MWLAERRAQELEVVYRSSGSLFRVRLDDVFDRFNIPDQPEWFVGRKRKWLIYGKESYPLRERLCLLYPPFAERFGWTRNFVLDSPQDVKQQLQISLAQNSLTIFDGITAAMADEYIVLHMRIYPGRKYIDIMTKIGPDEEGDEEQFAKFADDTRLKECSQGSFVVARFFADYDWCFECPIVDVLGSELLSDCGDHNIVSQPQPMQMGKCKRIEEGKVACAAKLPPGVEPPQRGILCEATYDDGTFKANDAIRWTPIEKDEKFVQAGQQCFVDIGERHAMTRFGALFPPDKEVEVRKESPVRIERVTFRPELNHLAAYRVHDSRGARHIIHNAFLNALCTFDLYENPNDLNDPLISVHGRLRRCFFPAEDIEREQLDFDATYDPI